MEEEIICASTNRSTGYRLIVAVCCLAAAAVIALMANGQYGEAREYLDAYESAYSLNRQTYLMGLELSKDPSEYADEHREYVELFSDMERSAKIKFGMAAVCAAAAVAFAGFWLYSGRTAVTVTDKRVYGTAAFGKAVDLPLSNVVMLSKAGNKDIAIATAAGKVLFAGIENRDQVYDALQGLVVNK